MASEKLTLGDGSLPMPMTALVGGVRYSTARATVLARGATGAGPAWMGGPKAAFLLRTADSHYLAQWLTPAGGDRPIEHYWLEPIGEIAAIVLYYELPEKPASFQEAFGPLC